MKIVSDLTATSATAGQRKKWHPGWLFRSGFTGAWFDPSDLTTLFQDVGGTVPVTAIGQPVGLMKDKSGLGNHASQADTARQPILRGNGTRFWLEFDGIDDRMGLETPLDLNTGTIIVAVSEPEDLVETRALVSGGTAGYIGVDGTAPNRGICVNAGATMKLVDSPAVVPLTQQCALGIRVQSGTIHVRTAQEAQEASNSVAASVGLEAARTLMSFGPASAYASRMDVYGLLFAEQQFSASDYDRALNSFDALI